MVQFISQPIFYDNNVPGLSPNVSTSFLQSRCFSFHLILTLYIYISLWFLFFFKLMIYILRLFKPQRQERRSQMFIQRNRKRLTQKDRYQRSSSVPFVCMWFNWSLEICYSYLLEQARLSAGGRQMERVEGGQSRGP